MTTASAIAIVPVDVRTAARLPLAHEFLFVDQAPIDDPVLYRGVPCEVIGPAPVDPKFAGVVHEVQPVQPKHLRQRGVALIAVVVSGVSTIAAAPPTLRVGDPLLHNGVVVGTFITPTQALVAALTTS